MNLYLSAVRLGRLKTKSYLQHLALDSSTLGSELWQQRLGPGQVTPLMV